MVFTFTYYLILTLYILVVILIPGIGLLLPPKKRKSTTATEGVSLLVPFRNESAGMTTLIKSINRLKFPKDQFEVLFIDDDSSDNSLALLDEIDHSIDFQLIQNPKHLGKKASLLAGAQVAKYDYVLTTDADCRLPGDLLGHLRSEDDLSIGAVIKATDRWNIIENIQEVESLMLAGITIGSTRMELPMLATGANLAYRKQVLLDTLPYEDNMHINSGDDMFLLKAVQKNGLSTKARTGLPVVTNTEKSWEDYITQAARWAGKNNDVGLLQASVSAWIVLLANLILPLSLITHFSSGWIILLFKFVVDFLFLFLSATRYERFKAILFAPIVFLIYPVHLVRVMIKMRNDREKR
jgi:cellulose synthase/poly-beta-1,6-N-acetylglucosamine synthase-like glycosyltransferase